jgi:PPOX class probable F420-dependent enzyme
MDIGRDTIEFIERAKVARLSTIDSTYTRPHLVPVVFVFDNNLFFLPIDEKKKKNTRVAMTTYHHYHPERLQRIKNIQSNANVCLLIDEYSDDWTKLAFVLIHGNASVVTAPSSSPSSFHPSSLSSSRSQLSKDLQSFSWENVYEKLVTRYPQYQVVGLSGVWIVIRPQKIVTWKNA